MNPEIQAQIDRLKGLLTESDRLRSKYKWGRIAYGENTDKNQTPENQQLWQDYMKIVTAKCIIERAFLDMRPLAAELHAHLRPLYSKKDYPFNDPIKNLEVHL